MLSLTSPTRTGTGVQVFPLTPPPPPRLLLYLESPYLFHVLSQQMYLGFPFCSTDYGNNTFPPNIIYEATAGPLPLPLWGVSMESPGECPPQGRTGCKWALLPLFTLVLLKNHPRNSGEPLPSCFLSHPIITGWHHGVQFEKSLTQRIRSCKACVVVI